ncbi:uncharacterized protein LOC143908985 [Arctopsyche grandis]|uniref:uncharacterized protein LOC143908985 n=1 Tax=Arctopsyche grandis TaxID=121162 RepID=UPI00406D6679
MKCRNLVVVIVIETFENIPQQQTTFPKPRRHAPAVIILNSGGTPLPVEWNQNGRNTPPPLKYIERKGAKHSRKFDASTKTKFLSYASITTSIKHSRKFDASTKTKFLSYASITTSIKHSRKFDASTKTKFLSYASITTSTKHSRNTIKGGTTQTTPVDPEQQASTHSSRPVNIQLLTSHHFTTRTWKNNQPATHCRIQRLAEHSRTPSQRHSTISSDLPNIAERRASDTLPYPATCRT